MVKTDKNDGMVYPKKKTNTIIAFLLIITGSTLATAFLIPVTGGSSDGSFYVPRNPFYLDLNPNVTIVEQPTITIDYPEDGEEYYDPSIEINVTVTGGEAPYTCEYRIDDNLWNDCGDCSNPLCGSARTFHAGSNTLTVRTTDANGQKGTDSLTFEININPNAVGDWDLLLFAPIVVGLYLVMEDSSKRRR